MTISLKDVGSGYKRSAINENFQSIEDEINNNLLSKNGGNALEADLDANSQKVINLANGLNGSDAVNLNQLQGAISAASSGLIASQIERQTGSSAVSRVFTFTGITYTVAANNLSVYRNGQRLDVGVDYVETSSSSVTLTFDPNDTDKFVFITNEATTTEVGDTASITHTQAGNTYNLKTFLNNNPVVRLKDGGAVGDGTTNDTSNIQAFLDANIGKHIIVDPGTYMIDGETSINIPSNSYITWLPGAEFKAIPTSNQSYKVLNIANKQNVHLYAPKVRGERGSHIIPVATSLTSTGTTATITTNIPHGITTIAFAHIFGADQSEYNGYYLLTRVSDTVATYTFAGSVTSPATGTITAEIGEQGHGIDISGATTENVRIYDPECYDCWGDGFAFRNGKNVRVYGLKIDNCRRQGLTINQGDDVKFYSPRSVNINGTAPGAGIDIEPNNGDFILKGISIINPYTENCEGAGLVLSLRTATVNNDVSIDIINHTDVGSEAGCSATIRAADTGFKMRGRVTIDNPTYIRNNQYGFLALDWRAPNSPMIYLNNPMVLDNNASGNSATFGSAISVQRNDTTFSGEDLGNIAIVNPTIRDRRASPLSARGIFATDNAATGASLVNFSIIDPLVIEGYANDEDKLFINMDGASISDKHGVTDINVSSNTTINAMHNKISSQNFYTVTDSVGDGASTMLSNMPMTIQSQSVAGIRFQPKAGEAVPPLSTVDGKYVQTTEKGASLTLQRIDNGSGIDWYVTNQVGNWTVEP